MQINKTLRKRGIRKAPTLPKIKPIKPLTVPKPKIAKPKKLY